MKKIGVFIVAVTIAKDEATSVVVGMPREATKRGAAEMVLGIEEITGSIGESKSSMASISKMA